MNTRRSSLVFSAVALLFASSALGGQVAFNPPSARVGPGDEARFEVAIAVTDSAVFDAFDILFSSDVSGLPMSFEYRGSLVTSLPVAAPTSLGLFPADLYIGGFNAGAWTPPLILGTLSVGTAGLSPGDEVVVHVRPEAEAGVARSPISGVSSAGALELLAGFARVIVAEAGAGDGTIEGTPPDGGTTVDPHDDGSDPTAPSNSTDDGSDAADGSASAPLPSGGAFCGVGMIGTFLVMFAGLTATRIGRRREIVAHFRFRP